jgi:hypothetical protein
MTLCRSDWLGVRTLPKPALTLYTLAYLEHGQSYVDGRKITQIVEPDATRRGIEEQRSTIHTRHRAELRKSTSEMPSGTQSVGLASQTIPTDVLLRQVRLTVTDSQRVC